MKKTVVLLAAIAMMTGYAFAQQPEKNAEAAQPETTEQTAPATDEQADKKEGCCDQKADEGKPCSDKACDSTTEEAPKAE